MMMIETWDNFINLSDIKVSTEISGDNADTTKISFNPDQGEPQNITIVGNWEWAQFVKLVNFVDGLRGVPNINCIG